MRVLLTLLILLAATTARADEAPAPAEAKAPTSWGKGSFQDRSRAEVSKLADDLLGEKLPAPTKPHDKNDNSSSK